MKTTIAILTVMLLTPLSGINTAHAQESRAQPWKRVYAGTDANESHVVGLWHFDADDVTKDSGPRGLTGKLDGAVAIATGKFGGGIESFPGWPVVDKHHALVMSHHPSLSLAGAFTAEMWLSAKPELAAASLAYLLDKKYASHNDYQWLLSTPEKSGARRMIVNLGFGSDSESFATEPILFAAGEWHHVAIVYDGAGTVRFYRDGSTVGTVSRPGRRGIASGSNNLSIGDRLGSNYGGFPGFIDEVRICNRALEFSPAAMGLSIERTVWIRHEPSPNIRITVRNLQAEPLTGATLSLAGSGFTADLIDVPKIEVGANHVFEKSFDTTLRPDDYELRARLKLSGDVSIEREDSLRIRLMPRPLPHRMPVLMWGIGSATEFTSELPRLKELGFTQCFGFGADYDSIWKAGQPVVVDAITNAGVIATRSMLDEALANDFGIAAQLQPGYFLKQRPDLTRVDRQGKPYARHDCNAALSGLIEFSENVGRSVAQTYGDHPAFVAALINSEVRDDSEVSFSEHDRAAYRRHSGRDIPEEVVSKSGVLWKSLKEFPADRVVPDDHPLLEFYRWFWTVGDGWNGLHTALHRGLKSTGRDDLWTWYDPAIRVPGIAGSGGEVDVLSQWTYTEPSPLRVGYYCDEVFAMAAASPRPQRVMKMTQLFWYRSTSAPKSTGANDIPSPFDDHDPDAAYISIAPMHLRGAFWSKVSRPVSGLMYHGWSSLVPTDNTHAYKYTQPEVIFEETLLNHELDRFKVLVLVDCDVLTLSVAARIGEFQKRGGVIIGDPNLAPAIKPDVLLPHFTRTRQTAEDKAAILANAAALRQTLDARYQRHAECSNPEIVTRVRTTGDSDYVFVVNDHREFGTYVGQHGLVMEHGLPSDGQIRIRRSAGHVYDLLVGREVPTGNHGDTITWPVQLGPCDGGVFLVTPLPIEQLEITASEFVQRGESLEVAITVADAQARPVAAVIPLQVEITDPNGRVAEFSGHHGAVRGSLNLKLDIAANDTPGVWKIHIRELASGKSATRFVRITP